jgi:hypothetical protein
VTGAVEFWFGWTGVEFPTRQHLILRENLISNPANLLGRFCSVEYFCKALSPLRQVDGDSLEFETVSEVVKISRWTLKGTGYFLRLPAIAAIDDVTHNTRCWPA